MPTYAVAAAGAVVVSTSVLLLVFGRLKRLNRLTLLSAAFATLISAAAFPLLFGLITRLRGGAADPSGLVLVCALAAVLWLVLVFIFSILITVLIPKAGKISVQSGDGTPEAENPAAAEPNENYLEKIYEKLVHENGEETAKNEETADHAENNLEISVDSSENIDKMGIENIAQNSVILTIEECIEEAFRCKDIGDAEGAIQYFIDALDKNPRKELTFWIVLDICVIYKNLEQVDLAYDILNSYHEAFGDMMDASVKEEIENNLFDSHVG